MLCTESAGPKFAAPIDQSIGRVSATGPCASMTATNCTEIEQTGLDRSGTMGRVNGPCTHMRPDS